MDSINLFNHFAAAFEATVQDDDWSRLAKYLATDATYLNVGGPDSKFEGRDSILDYLKGNVANSDRRFDTRKLVGLTPPKAEGNRLSRQWRCTYTLAGTPDLVVEGEARYQFEDDLIKEIEEEPTEESMQKYTQWMQEYGDMLHA